MLVADYRPIKQGSARCANAARPSRKSGLRELSSIAYASSARWAVSVPLSYTDLLVQHTLSLVATTVRTDDVRGCWLAPGTRA